MNEIRNFVGKLLDHRTRVKIKNMGPPRPDLTMQQGYSPQQKKYTRFFTRSVYERAEWLCGCDEKNLLYCFPCTLFGSDNVWAKNGYSDLSHLKQKLRKHATSAEHLRNELNFAFLGETGICFDNHLLRLEQHKRVDKNRYMLSQLVDYIKFCGVKVVSGAETLGVLQGFAQFMNAIDCDDQDQLTAIDAFKNTYQTIHEDILNSIVLVAQCHIQTEIEEAEYLSVQVDKITETCCAKQLSIIFRYERDGEVCERCWGFVPSENQSAYEISTYIDGILSKLGVDKHPAKLIGHTYDGSSVLSDSEGSVRYLLKQKYPAANFIHCYAHTGSCIVQQTASLCKEANLFFSDIEAVPSFFNKSQEMTNILSEVVKKRNPEACPKWNFDENIVSLVHVYRKDLVDCLEIIRDSSQDRAAMSVASSLIRLLEDENFLFWLKFFHEIMSCVENVFTSVGKENLKSAELRQIINSFIQDVSKIQKRLSPSITTNEANSPPSKRKRYDEPSLILSAHVLCDKIKSQIKSRIEGREHLSASLLLVPFRFFHNRSVFPKIDYENAVEIFTDLVQDKLWNELEIIYSRNELLRLSGAVALLRLLAKNNLHPGFSEISKLAKCVVTLPMVTNEKDRCLSTLDTIKRTFSKKIEENKLDAAIVLATSKKLIHSIPNFNLRVIEEFAKINKAPDFIYM